MLRPGVELLHGRAKDSYPRSLHGAPRLAMYPHTISLIVPALNEERVLGGVIVQILERVDGHFRDYELILVDDGSTDSTGQIMDDVASENSRVRVIHNRKNLGFGSSYRRGLEEARFDYVALLCGDGGLPASSLPLIFDEIGTADIIIPWMINLREIKSVGRYVLSLTFTGVLNTLFGLHLHYYNGLPVHRRELLGTVEITSGGFGFQAEILVKLIRAGATYVEVGVKGAEETRQSDALRVRNWLSVGRTVYHLVHEIWRLARLNRSNTGRGGKFPSIGHPK